MMLDNAVVDAITSSMLHLCLLVKGCQASVLQLTKMQHQAGLLVELQPHMLALAVSLLYSAPHKCMLQSCCFDAFDDLCGHAVL